MTDWVHFKRKSVLTKLYPVVPKNCILHPLLIRILVKLVSIYLVLINYFCVIIGIFFRYIFTLVVTAVEHNLIKLPTFLCSYLSVSEDTAFGLSN